MTTTVTCQRCGYTWQPMVPAPKSCPRCHSYTWQPKPT